MVRYSILLPLVPDTPSTVSRFGALAAFSGAYALWQGQSLKVEASHSFATLADQGFSTPVGIGVALMPLLHPFEAALRARSLAATIARPVTVGFGPGAPEFQRALRGAPYESPLRATSEYVRIVRQLLDGRQVDVSGEYFTCQASLPAMRTRRIEVGVGVLRPLMAKLAGVEADCAITWLTPASYLRDVIVPEIERAASGAGRTPPRIVAIVPVALSRGDRDSTHLALASNAPHFQAAHYRDMLRKAGAELGDGSLPCVARGAVAARAFISGDLDEIAGAMHEYAESGVDEIVLNVTGVNNLYGPHAAVKELQTLLEAFQS